MKKATLFILLALGMLISACSGGSQTVTVESTVSLSNEPSTEQSATIPSEPISGLNRLGMNSWMWVGFTDPNQEFRVEDPESYLLTFQPDRRVTIKADCNNATGNYSLEDNKIKIDIGPMTRAMCPPGSRSDDFIKYLQSAAIYFYKDNNLFLDLMADGGTMEFAQAGDLKAENALPEDLTAQLDAFLQSQVFTEGGNPALAAPGLVLLVETPEGRYLNAVGVADLETGTPMMVSDKLEIGSNTKSMTIVLLMQLVEEGLVSLDDPLSKWLPEQAAILPNGDQITIRQMAQHTAGLWDYGDEIIGGGVSDTSKLEAGYTPAELVQYAVDKGTPYFKPGETGQWKYSNTGYILLGMILEKVTGKSLGDLYQSRIFNPLGLESAVLIEGVPQEGEITTHGYWWTENGDMVDTTNWNGSQGWAAGAVAMTAEDLATYAKALAAGELFKNPDTLKEMLVFNPSAEFTVGFPYGLGLGDFSGDGKTWGHGGQTLGFQSLWFTNPEKGIRVVGLTNSAAYKAVNILNVLNIIEGEGVLPISPVTLMPLGRFVPSTWVWTQFLTPSGKNEMDKATALNLQIAKDKSVTINSLDCGSATGTYSAGGAGTIDFDIDGSTLTCNADSPAVQFVQHLNDASRWQFSNGRLVIELPADGGSLVFELSQ